MSFAGFAEHPPEKTGSPARSAAADTCFVKSRLHIFSVNIVPPMIAFPIRYINSDKFKGGNAGGMQEELVECGRRLTIGEFCFGTGVAYCCS